MGLDGAFRPIFFPNRYVQGGVFAKPFAEAARHLAVAGARVAHRFAYGRGRVSLRHAEMGLVDNEGAQLDSYLSPCRYSHRLGLLHGAQRATRRSPSRTYSQGSSLFKNGLDACFQAPPTEALGRGLRSGVFPEPTNHLQEVLVMIRTLLTLLLAILAAIWLIRDVESYAREAAIEPSVGGMRPGAPPALTLPQSQEPFDLIKPVESAGAPMYGG